MRGEWPSGRSFGLDSVRCVYLFFFASFYFLWIFSLLPRSHRKHFPQIIFYPSVLLLRHIIFPLYSGVLVSVSKCLKSQHQPHHSLSLLCLNRPNSQCIPIPILYKKKEKKISIKEIVSHKRRYGGGGDFVSFFLFLIWWWYCCCVVTGITTPSFSLYLTILYISFGKPFVAKQHPPFSVYIHRYDIYDMKSDYFTSPLPHMYVQYIQNHHTKSRVVNLVTSSVSTYSHTNTHII